MARRPVAGTPTADATATEPPITVASADPHGTVGRRPLWRRLTVLGLVIGLLFVSQPAALADPPDLNTVPATLRQYVVGSPQWTTSSWMTSTACRDRGGDFSLYAAAVMKDTPALLEFFDPLPQGSNDAARNRWAAIMQGYRDVAAQMTVPTGYCVDQVRQWAGASTWKPFGFDWGNATGEHRTDYRCTNSIGADNAPCGGFYVSCSGAKSQQDHTRCEAWNAFSDDYVKRVNAARAKAIRDFPGTGVGESHEEIKSPGDLAQDVLDWSTKQGIQQLVAFVVEGNTKLWALFIKVISTYAGPDLGGAGFTSVYNLVAGVALALAFLGWLVTLATSWRQGRMQYSLFGGLKAAAGVTLAGVAAILMLQLAQECTVSLASAGGDLSKQADFTQSLAKANPLVALIIGTVIALFMVFALVFLVMHGPLVMGWALMGALAAAGQVNPASAGWLPKWAGRFTGLAWSPFVMVAWMLLAQALMLPLDAGDDVVKQFVALGQGLLLVVLLAGSPYLMWEFLDFVSDRIGGAAASGSPASNKAASEMSSVANAMSSAVGSMMSSSADLNRQFPGGSTSGTGDGGANSGGDGSSGPPAGEQAPGGAGTVPPSGTPGEVTKPGQDSGSGGAAPDSGTGTKPGPDSGSDSGGATIPPAANRGSVVASRPPQPSGGGGSGGGGGGSGAAPKTTGSGGAGSAAASAPPIPPG